MIVHPIASSSSGNCTVLEFGDDVVLIDCGVTLKAIKSVINDLNRIKAVFITHEHYDHIAGVGPLSRKLTIPFYVNNACAKKAYRAFNDCTIKHNVVAGETYELPGIGSFLAFSTKHDAAYSVGYIVTPEGSDKKFGYLTDTGFITPFMITMLKECSAMFIESDYDDEFLEECELYADELKERIKSNFGHLSNAQVKEFITNNFDILKLDFIILGHLSGKTNSVSRVNEIIIEPFNDNKDKFHIAPLVQGIKF